MLNVNAINRITSLSPSDILLVGDRNIAMSKKGRNDLYLRRIRYSDLLTSLISDLEIPPSIELLDEDNMASNSDTKGATQQSIKTYVDNAISSVPSNYLPLAGGTMSGNINMNLRSLNNTHEVQFNNLLGTIQTFESNGAFTLDPKNGNFVKITVTGNSTCEIINLGIRSQLLFFFIENPDGFNFVINGVLNINGDPYISSATIDIVIVLFDGISLYAIPYNNFV